MRQLKMKKTFKLICTRNYSDLLYLLIHEYGAELNGRNPDTLWTPLHSAAAANSTEVVYVIILI